MLKLSFIAILSLLLTGSILIAGTDKGFNGDPDVDVSLGKMEATYQVWLQDQRSSITTLLDLLEDKMKSYELKNIGVEQNLNLRGKAKSKRFPDKIVDRTAEFENRRAQILETRKGLDTITDSKQLEEIKAKILAELQQL